MADDASALDYNPAGLALIHSPRLSLMHHQTLGLFKQDILSYVRPISPSVTLAMGLHSLTQGGIEKIDNTGAPQGATFAPAPIAPGPYRVESSSGPGHG